MIFHEWRIYSCIKGSFKDLDEAIKKLNNITLSDDIIVLESEHEQFTDGIIINKNIVIDGKGFKVDAWDKVRIFQVQKILS
jgi:hypothetical protein